MPYRRCPVGPHDLPRLLPGDGMNWPEDYIGRVLHGDCLEVMKGMPDGCVDLVLTDPPYGMDRFETDGKDYLEKISPALFDLDRVLCDGGSAFVFTSTGEVMKVGGGNLNTLPANALDV